MQLRVSLEGDKELIALLENLASKEIYSACGEGLDAAAAPIVEKAQALAPEVTGELKRKIRSRPAKRRARGEVRRVVASDAVAEDGTRYPYVVERRKPYLRPAFDLVGGQAGDLAIETIGDAVAKRWARGGGAS